MVLASDKVAPRTDQHFVSGNKSCLEVKLIDVQVDACPSGHIIVIQIPRGG